LDPSVVLPAFAVAWFNSPAGASHFRRAGKTTSGLNTISANTVRSAPTLLPPLDEQRRIAAILDRADALLVKRRRVLDQLDALTLSIFDHSFGRQGWPHEPLALLCETIADCPHSTPRWTDQGEVCIRTSNLTCGGWDWSDKRYVSIDDYTLRSRRSEIAPGDIILSREGTVGIAAIVESGMRICMGQRLVQVRVDQRRVSAEFVLHYLLHALDPERISHVMVGSTARHLNVGELRALAIPVPPLELQREFSNRLHAIGSLRSKAVAISQDERTLMQSLQARAFSGSL
jgi:type I restriction enzyme S subunit